MKRNVLLTLTASVLLWTVGCSQAPPPVADTRDADIKAIKENRAKPYPDLSPTVSAFPTKKSLEGRFNTEYRNFDLSTADAMTVDSYRAARERDTNAAISNSHADPRFRGNSRLGAWLKEFQTFAAERSAGTGDRRAPRP